MSHIYLDYAAATPVATEVLEAIQPFFSEKFYNPSATYLAARDVHQDVGKARQTVARQLGVKPAEIIFTAGATEANNLAIQGVLRQFPGCEVLVTAIEHESVLAPARLFSHREIPVSTKGIIDPATVEKMVNDKTVLVSIGFVNNEIGVVQPLAEIAKLLNKLSNFRKATHSKLPLLLHTDAAQAGNYLDLHVSRLGVDLLSLNGGKIYGPKQSGALFVRAGVQLQPLIVGGGQEWNLRSGTENVPAIIGFAKALELTQQKRAAETKRINSLRELFENLVEEKIPGAVINGPPKHKAPHIISLTLPGQDNERLMMKLDEQGVECAVGSACSASRDEPSHVLSAIGLSDEQARSTLRFSFGRYNTESEVTRTIRLLTKLLDNK